MNQEGALCTDENQYKVVWTHACEPVLFGVLTGANLCDPVNLCKPIWSGVNLWESVWICVNLCEPVWTSVTPRM